MIYASIYIPCPWNATVRYGYKNGISLGYESGRYRSSPLAGAGALLYTVYAINMRNIWLHCFGSQL